MPKKLVLQGHVPGITLDHYHKLDLTLEPDDLNHDPIVNWLVTTGTVTVDIHVPTVPTFTLFEQLAETDNVLTTVTITGASADLLNPFGFGIANLGDFVVTGIAATATSPTTIHSSLSLIDASATTGDGFILAGATNTSGLPFVNGATLNSNITITYDGLTIKGGSGHEFIENDAKDGVVTVGNHDNDAVVLAGAGASATLGTGANDQVAVGASLLGTNEDPGQALGTTVTFGNVATATLVVGAGTVGFTTVSGHGAEAGPTASTQNIGQTNVNGAAAGMVIDFHSVTTSNTIANETAAVSTAATLTAAEHAAVAALGGPGVAYFDYHNDEYLIATNNTETSVSAHDAIVHLVGVVGLTASISDGVVTLV